MKSPSFSPLMRIAPAGIAAAAAFAALAPAANAQYYYAYNDLGAYSGTTIAQSVPIYNSGGVFESALYAAPITVASGYANLTVTQVQFAIFNPTADSFSARVRFRLFDTTSTAPAGGPGTYLVSGYSPLENFVPGLNVFTFNNGGALTPVIPANGQLWYSEFFDNGGGATVSAADLAALAFPLYGAPSVGSTTNNYFVSSTASSNGYTTNNPAGSIVTTTPNGGRFGIALQTSVSGAATPEPITGSLLCFGGLGLWAGLGRLRKRR